MPFGYGQVKTVPFDLQGGGGLLFDFRADKNFIPTNGARIINWTDAYNLRAFSPNGPVFGSNQSVYVSSWNAGRPAITAGGLVMNTTVNHAQQKWTIYYVGQDSGNHGGGCQLCIGAVNFVPYMSFTGNTTNIQCSSGHETLVWDTPVPTFGAPFQMNITVDLSKPLGSMANLRVNGVNRSVTSTGTSGTSPLFFAGSSLANLNLVSSSFYGSSLCAEFYVVNAIHTLSQRQALESVLATRWSVP